MIEVSIAHDKAFNSLSDFAQLLYLKILPHTDDFGRFEGDPDVVWARVAPLSEKNIEKYESAMREIAKAGLWLWYLTDKGRKVIQYNVASFERINAFLIKQRKNAEFPPYRDSYELICGDMLPYHLESNKYKAISIKQEEKKENDVFSPVLDQWNSFASQNGLAKCLKMSDKRSRAALARSKEVEFDLAKIFEAIRTSPFLLGENDRGWKVDFDWVFCSANNYLKILEGKYANSGRSGSRNSGAKAGGATTGHDLAKSFEAGRKLILGK